MTKSRFAILVGGLTACLSVVSCGGPSDASAHANGGKMVLQWLGGAARLCITDTDATCPTDKDGHVTGGKALWVVDAVCWNNGAGFSSPVMYGVTPDCAKDVTADNGGPAGGAPMVSGKQYKMTVTGFGSAPTIQEITAP